MRTRIIILPWCRIIQGMPFYVFFPNRRVFVSPRVILLVFVRTYHLESNQTPVPTGLYYWVGIQPTFVLIERFELSNYWDILSAFKYLLVAEVRSRTCYLKVMSLEWFIDIRATPPQCIYIYYTIKKLKLFKYTGPSRWTWTTNLSLIGTPL